MMQLEKFAVQGIRLLRLILMNRPPKTALHILLILSVVMTVYVVVINFTYAGLERFVAPWVKQLPHAIYEAPSCDQFPLATINDALAQADLPPATVACARSANVSLVKYEPGAPRIVETRAVEFHPGLAAVIPALADPASLQRPGRAGVACLQSLPATMELPELLGGSVGVSDCDSSDRALSPLVMGVEFSQITGIRPGHAVALLPPWFTFSGLERFSTEKPPEELRDHVVAATVRLDLPTIRNVVLVPRGSLAPEAKISTWAIVRVNGVQSLATLKRVMTIIDQKGAESSTLFRAFSVTDASLWDAERVTTNLLNLIRGVVVLLVILVSMLSISQYIQRERKAFAIYRICGFTDLSIIFTIATITVTAFLLSCIAGGVLGVLACELVNRVMLPDLRYSLDIEALVHTSFMAIIFSTLSSWAVMRYHFSRDVASEFQDVSEFT